MKVLIIGPFPQPVTGNSLANQVVFENLALRKENITVDNVNTSFSSFKEDLGELSVEKVWHYIKQYIGIFKVFNSDKLYYTTGQTFYGVIKYLPYLVIAKIIRTEITVHVHGDYLHKEFNSLSGIKRYLFKRVFQLCDKGIVLSKSLKRNLLPFLPNLLPLN